MLCKPLFTLTWYPGEYPSTASPLVLQSAEHYVEDGYASLGGRVTDNMQVADFLRSPAPAVWNRGNRKAEFDWEEVRDFADPSAALAAGMEIIAEMPSEVGWLRLEIPAQGRAWAGIPCGLKSAAFPRVVREGKSHLLKLQWTLLCGPASEIAVEAEEGAITTEIGTEILTEDGEFYLALEELT
jgi:hypothetical protein